MTPEDIVEAFRVGGVELTVTPDRTIQWSSWHYPTQRDGSVHTEALIELARQQEAVIQFLVDQGAFIDPADATSVEPPLPTPVHRGTIWPPILSLLRFSPTSVDIARDAVRHPREIERMVYSRIGAADGRLVSLYWVLADDTLELLAVCELSSALQLQELAPLIELGGAFVVHSTTRLRTTEALLIGQSMAAEPPRPSGE